jgi:hypothetical protein
MLTRLKLPLFVIFFTLPTLFLAADVPTINERIKQLDEKFFTAFNECDVDTIATMFSKDLEFYHDIAGFGDYTANMKATQNLCERQLGLVRTLNLESLEIYPIKDFGAMQLGQHTFCHKVDGEDDCGTFGFAHVWKQTETGWVLHRVMSYGH